MVYTINYDLRKPGRNYEGLYRSIKSLDGYAHVLDSTWLVSTSLSAQAIVDQLRPHIDENDFLLVIQAGRDYSGRLPENMWDWLRSAA